MSFKKVISLLLVVLMTASLAFSMVACQEEDANNERINHLPDQLENQRYYFQQGYTKETWDVAIGENDYYLRRIQQTAKAVAQIDAFACLALVAERKDYVRAMKKEKGVIDTLETYFRSCFCFFTSFEVFSFFKLTN